MSGRLVGRLPLGTPVRLDNGKWLSMDANGVDEWVHSVELVPVLLNHDPGQTGRVGHEGEV